MILDDRSNNENSAATYIANVSSAETKLQAAAVRLAFQQSSLALAAAFINAIILALILVKVVPYQNIAYWFLVSLALTVYRYITTLRYFKTNPGDHESRKWGRDFLILTFLSGLVWGSAGIFLFPAGSIAHQMFMILVVGGICAGSVATYASVKLAVPLLTVTSLIPLFIRVVLTGDQIHLATGLLILLFIVVVITSAYRVHKTTITSLRLRLDNTNLIATLEQEKIWVEQLNEELKAEIEERKATEAEKEKLITQLQEAIEEIKKLGGMLPICTNCKKIRDDMGFWKQVEDYISEHSEVKFSHSLCPTCLDELYPDHKRWHEKANEKRKENGESNEN